LTWSLLFVLGKLFQWLCGFPQPAAFRALFNLLAALQRGVSLLPSKEEWRSFESWLFPQQIRALRSLFWLIMGGVCFPMEMCVASFSGLEDFQRMDEWVLLVLFFLDAVLLVFCLHRDWKEEKTKTKRAGYTALPNRST
jgi:hypothetical protein